MPAHTKNFSWLLFALLVFLLGIPVIEAAGVLSPGIIRALIISWLLVVGVWSLRGFGKLFVAGLLLAGFGVILNVWAASSADTFLQYASFATLFAFLLIAVWCAAQHVVSGTAITRNRLLGSVCVYLLMGVAWAIAYTIVEMVSPGSFRGFEPRMGQGWDSNWLYFSFVTMSTLGYGDISPVTPIARMLAYLQAVFGLFYIAILVAGLVGAYISDRQDDRPG